MRWSINLLFILTTEATVASFDLEVAGHMILDFTIAGEQKTSASASVKYASSMDLCPKLRLIRCGLNMLRICFVSSML